MTAVSRASWLTFRGFAGVVVLFFACIGILFGLTGFVGSLFGGHVFITLGPLHLQGLTAGLLGLPLMPALFSFAGFIAALVFYLPARWVLSLL